MTLTGFAVEREARTGEGAVALDVRAQHVLQAMRKIRREGFPQTQLATLGSSRACARAATPDSSWADIEGEAQARRTEPDQPADHFLRLFDCEGCR